MALDTYSDLTTTIADYTHRSDLTSVIPGFVSLAEKRILRDIVRQGGHSVIESSTTLTPSAGAVTLPANFLAARSVSTSSTPSYTVAATSLEALKTGYSLAGSGKVYSISGTSMLLSPDADDYDIVLNYWFQPTSLSGSNTTNELFPTANDCYLYASLIEAMIYTKSDPSAWVTAYTEAINSFIKANRSSIAGASLTVRAA